MDYYTVFFLNPKTGNRILMDGVTAEVEVVGGHFDSSPAIGRNFKKKTPFGSHLDIVLEIENTDFDQLEKIKEEIMMNEMLIYFKDTHPNLIKGRVTGMAVDSRKTTIKFTGNTTDKTYHDFVSEVTNKFNAEQFNWSESTEDPIDDGIVNQNQKPKRKDMVLKRKLTFK